MTGGGGGETPGAKAYIGEIAVHGAATTEHHQEILAGGQIEQAHGQVADAARESRACVGTLGGDNSAAHFGATIAHLLTRKLPARVMGERATGRLMHAEKTRVLPPRARELWLAQVLPQLGTAARILAKPVEAMMGPPPPSAAFADLESAA